jgi:hypothetical protein
MGINIHTYCIYVLTRVRPKLCPGMSVMLRRKRILLRAKKRNREPDLIWLAPLLPAFRTRCALQSQEVDIIIIYKSLLRYGHMVVVFIFSSKFLVQITNAKYAIYLDGMSNVARYMKIHLRKCFCVERIGDYGFTLN